MGYRFNNNPPKPEDLLKRFDVRNGAIMRAAFECYYAKEGHDTQMHDHLGWPYPGHPDDICQMPQYPNEHPRNHKPTVFEPIKLIDEGYTDAYVAFEDNDAMASFEATAWIDEENQNIVRMKVHPSLTTFTDKPKDFKFTLFIKKSDNSSIDAVCYGIISVLPGRPDAETDVEEMPIIDGD